MDFLLDTLSYTFNQRALLAATMIGFLNGFFGSYIVLRREALFAGALSHTLFPGIALGALIAGVNPLSALLGACVMALLVGLCSQSFAVNTRADINSLLAVFWTATFAGGLLVLDNLALNIDVESFLFGNILGVSDFDLWFTFVTGFAVLSLVILFQRTLVLAMFSPEIAATQGVPVRKLEVAMAGLLVLVMITSLQAVGTILTLGLLVAPAAILDLYVESPRGIMWGGGLLGALLASVSVFLSNAFSVQTGPLIVILLGLLYLAALLTSPRHGVLARILQHRALSHD